MGSYENGFIILHKINAEDLACWSIYNGSSVCYNVITV